MNRPTEALLLTIQDMLRAYRNQARRSFAVIALCACFPNSLSAQHWVQTSAPVTNWSALACSADGTKIIAQAAFDPVASPAPMFVSIDAGITWRPTPTPLTNWWSLVCSADGQRIIATADAYSGGDVFWVSTNTGATWVGKDNPVLESIASSADGMKLLGANFHWLETSTNGGATWTSNTIPHGMVYRIVSSADGTRLAALAIDALDTVFWVYASTNSGATWDQLPGPDNSNNYGSLTCSADGRLLVASISLLGIYISSDWGQSWRQPNQAQGFVVAISSDGSTLFMTDTSAIYRSTDSGVNWVNLGAPQASWGQVVCSADGSKLIAAAARNGGIYLWQPGPAPTLNLSLPQDGVLLSWPAPSNAILQQNTDLAAGIWTQMSLTPTLTNGQYQLLIPPTNGNCFYRLKGF